MNLEELINSTYNNLLGKSNSLNNNNLLGKSDSLNNKTQKSLDEDWCGVYIDDEVLDYYNAKGEKCYLVEMYDRHYDFIKSKVGTTNRAIKQRMNEILRDKTYSNIYRIEVKRVYSCGDYPAEMLESAIRAKYIQRYPEAFEKNDRFIGVHFDFNETDKIFEAFLKNA